MQIYNANYINRNDRLIKAILVGLVSSIVLGVIYGLISIWSSLELEIFFIALGYLIGELIKRIGKGVGTPFKVIAALFTLFAIMLGDSIAYLGVNGALYTIFHPSHWASFIKLWMTFHLSISLSNLLGIIFRCVGIYYAYNNATIF